MVHQLPIGAKDLLPLDVLQKHWIEQRLNQTFKSWGYHQIITPTLEKLDTLTAGGAVEPQAVIQLQGEQGQILGLRPEFTASIARAYASRLEKGDPQRLYYHANVFRQGDATQETFQAGVELLGAEGALADAEIILLLANCLQQLELPSWELILGHSGLTQTLLTIFPASDRAKIRQCLANLDRVQLEQIDSPWQNLALNLFQLRGEPSLVLAKLSELSDRARQLQPQWWEVNCDTVQAQTTNLQALVSLWPNHSLVLDLSLIQSFDYYTGIVFEVVCGYEAIAQGGRYDHLLELYHPQQISHAGIGFCLNLENLQKALVTQLPQQVSGCDWLVVACSSTYVQATFAYADKLRHQNHSVEIYLEFQPEPVVRAYAQNRNLRQIAWIDQQVKTENLNSIP
ncbi:MAG: ATP phosphoribosyltransferase regulatory subunit [Pseudanabaenaceae cyanobacterium bins.68]|nr:ATP phosphoribosyltransferase regulatory subunit [Pseudanabaenaceae cyanobacterium bins.68]